MQSSAKDRTFYVVGNGPSLKDFDFGGLKTRAWLGMNAAYRHWDRIGHYPTHYACLDQVVGLSHKDAIARLIRSADACGIEQFLLDDGVADAVESVVGAHHPKVIRASSVFGHDPELLRRITTGSHSVLWSATLGYPTITLLGIDQNYLEEVEGLAPGDGSRLDVVSETDSPNYYFADYQQVGDALNRPNPVPNVHASAWRRVMRRIATNYPNTAIHNASPLSTLPGAQSVSLEDVFIDQITPSLVPANALGDAAILNASNIDIAVARNLTTAQALEHLLPVRFCEFSSTEPSIKDFGLGWRDIKPSVAANDGRWYLQVGRFDVDPVQPKLGSVFFLPPSAPTPQWMPEAARYFDQTIRIHGETDGHVLGVLALRLDDINSDLHGMRINPSRAQRIIRSAKRLFWKSVRRLDAARSDRNAG